MQAFGMSLSNSNTPTRKISSSESCIDLFFSNIETSTRVKELAISDHSAVSLKFKVNFICNEKLESYNRKWKKLELADFLLKFNFYLHHLLTKNTLFFEVAPLSVCFERLFKCIEITLNNFIPVKSRTTRKN